MPIVLQVRSIYRRALVICEEFEELSGAYVLEAVTPTEREAAQAHLSECAACTHRLQELRVVVNLLPYSVLQVNPAKSLKVRLFEAIRMESTSTHCHCMLPSVLSLG